MRPFTTPLFEVSSEVDFDVEPIVEFRARSFRAAIKQRCPEYSQFPVVFIPPEQATPEQLQMTPAVYRFYSTDETFSAFIGPRMVAANVRGWTGYPRYRGFVEEVFDQYLALMEPAKVLRYSVGFYNRIPIADVDEFNEVIAKPPPLGQAANLDGLVYQVHHETSVGMALTQMLMRPPDVFTTGQYLGVNNIIQVAHAATETLALSAMLGWLDQAHEAAKGMLWEMLSEKAKDSWIQTSGDDVKS